SLRRARARSGRALQQTVGTPQSPPVGHRATPAQRGRCPGRVLAAAAAAPGPVPITPIRSAWPTFGNGWHAASVPTASLPTPRAFGGRTREWVPACGSALRPFARPPPPATCRRVV